MRHGRHLVAAALAGPLALSLVAAAAPSSASHGTASTTLSAVDLTVTTPLGDGALGVLDAETFASTAAEAADSVPFASALLTPLTGPNGPVGRVEARSDGSTSADAAGTSLSGLGGPIAAVGGEVAPAVVRANATAQEAHAVIGALTARIAGLAGALGVTVNASDIASHVTADRATATQGLQVSELSVSLGDIVPQDVLASLPLPDLLALLKALPLQLPGDVTTTIEGLEDAIADLTAQLTVAGATSNDIDGTTDELEELTGVLDALLELAELEAAAELLGDSDDPDAIGAIQDGVNLIDDTLTTVTDGSLVQLSSHDCGATTKDELLACIDGLEADLLTSVDVDSVAELEAVIAELVAELEALVASLIETVEGVVPLLERLLALAADLDDLLAALEGLLGDAAGLPLVGVSSFDIGVNSLSDGTLEGSRASVLCEAVTVTILGESVTTPGCSDGLTAVRDAAGVVNGLVGGLTETLNVLPLTDVLTTGELKVDLFSDLQESVVERDGEVIATAGVTILDLEIPSVTIDPGAATDLLDQLGVPDVLGTVEGLLADALAEVQALGLPELSTVTTTLTAATTELGVEGGIEDLLAELQALIDGLALGELGTLESVSTPGLSLVVDPVSTASFATSSAAPADPTGGPDPAPAGPSLPTTGGGLALLGLASLAGAFSLRRRG